MHITIDSKDTLNTFAFAFSKHTKLSVSQIKDVIAKSQGFDYITPFESALAPINKPQASTESEEHIKVIKYYADYLSELDENLEEETLALLEVKEPYELSSLHLNQLNDNIRDAANSISYNSKLSEALALLRAHGHDALVSDILDAATNASRSIIVEGYV